MSPSRSKPFQNSQCFQKRHFFTTLPISFPSLLLETPSAPNSIPQHTLPLCPYPGPYPVKKSHPPLQVQKYTMSFTKPSHGAQVGVWHHLFSSIPTLLSQDCNSLCGNQHRAPHLEVGYLHSAPLYHKFLEIRGLCLANDCIKPLLSASPNPST